MSVVDVDTRSRSEFLTRQSIGRFVQANISYVAFIFLVVIFGLLGGSRFLSLRNLQLILEQLPILAILAVGMTFVITGGFIDLSVGSVLGFSALCAALGAQNFGTWGLLLGIVAGAGVGFINGLLFARLKIPSFIVTLAALVIVRAVVSIASGGFAVFLDQTNSVKLLATAGRFPWIVLLFALVAAVALLFYNSSIFGRDLKAVGGNERVVGRGGVNVPRLKILVFTLSGTLAGIASIFSLAQFGAAGPQTGVGLELDAISAVVLGGTPLTGGYGSVAKTIVGALALVTLADGLTIIGVPPSWNEIVRGCLLIVAIAIALDRRKIGVVK
jgi:ribose/xylose/arabinose/galactoside ABC-type transport system permease subunit